MSRSTMSLALPLLVLAGACARETGAPSEARTYALQLEADASPADSGAAEPNLSVAPDGRVLLSWIAPGAQASAALRFSVREANGGWSAPRDVIRRDDLMVNWADFPSIVTLSDGRLLAHWLQKSGGGKYDYEVRMAESRDAGATWGERVTPHTPGIPGEHGFAAILPTADGGAGVVFLNGGAGSEDQHPKAMHLGYATWGAQGGVASRAVIDHRVCDCCQTGIAQTTRGPVVVYRDRTDAEVRDMSIVRLVDGSWTEPKTIHADNWTINGCPVNGPSVAALGDTVVVAWFAAPADSARVQVAFSTDAGATFGAPMRIDGGLPTGRVDVELLDGGAALVSWIERTGGEGAEVRARVVRRTGLLATDAPLVVSSSQATRSSGFPRMVRTSSGVLMAWTMPGSPSAVRTALVRVE